MSQNSHLESDRSRLASLDSQTDEDAPDLEGLTKAKWSIRQRYRTIRARTGCLKGLDLLWLEITRSCNMSCAHCYAGSSPHMPLIEAMRFSDWCWAMEEARSLGCRQLQFIGGEPTIHPELVQLIEHSKRVGFNWCEVFTNATLLRGDLIETFKRLGVRVATSFYSYDPATHDQITNTVGSFDNAVDGIRRLVKQRVPLRAGVILMEQNSGHFRDTKNFLKGLGVRSIGRDSRRGIGRGGSISPDSRPTSELCGDCWRRKLCISSDGNAYPCVFSRFSPVGNVLTDGIKEIVEGARLTAFRRVSYLG